MTNDEKLERVELIIKLKTKMERMMLFYFIVSIGIFLWFAFQPYPSFVKYLPIGILNLGMVGLMGYSYFKARKSLHSEYQEYSKIKNGENNV